MLNYLGNLHELGEGSDVLLVVLGLTALLDSISIYIEYSFDRRHTQSNTEKLYTVITNINKYIQHKKKT